jgi:hypothetical protein
MAGNKDWLPRNHEKLLTKGTLIYNRARIGFAAESPQGTRFDNNCAPNLTRLKNAFDARKDPSTHPRTAPCISEEYPPSQRQGTAAPLSVLRKRTPLHEP